MDCPDALSRLKTSLRENIALPPPDSSNSDVPPQLTFATWEVRISEELRQSMIDGYEKDRTLKPIRDKLKLLPLDAHGGQELSAYPFRLEKDLMFFRETAPATAGRYRLVIPKSVTRIILEKGHDEAGHLAAKKLLQRLVLEYYWKNMRTDILEYVKYCPECLLKTTKRHPPFGTLNPIEVPPHFGHTITMDLTTDLPECTKFNHGDQKFDTILVMVEKLTRMVKCIPGHKDYKSPDWARLVFEDAKWGFPTVIISDRDGRFAGDFFQAFLAMTKTKSHMTTALNPQSDGQSERMVQTVQHILRNFSGAYQDDWANGLPYVEFAINNTTVSRG